MDWMRRLSGFVGLPLFRSTSVESHPPHDPHQEPDPLERETVERLGVSMYGAQSGATVRESSAPELSSVGTRALQKIMSLPEGSLYVAGGMVLFEDREVFEAAKVLADHGVDFSDFESRAEIISRARNEHPDAFPSDDLAGYYEDFPR